MEYLLNSAEMRQCDARTSTFFGIPSPVLMERAALACVQSLCDPQNAFLLTSVLVVCGSGNNGGDGFAVARLLHERGINAEILFAGREEKLTQDAALQKKICENYGIPIKKEADFQTCTCIVDAMFGIGLSRELTGEYRRLAEQINESKAKVLAVDIPSGVSADNGHILGAAVRADVTVTFAFRKLGHVLYPGAAYCGKVLCAQIGITRESLTEEPKICAIAEEILSGLPRRSADSNKGTYGKALMAAGTLDMCGAAALSAQAAYRTGTGLVRILTEDCNRVPLQTLLPEAILTTLNTNPDMAEPSLLDRERAKSAMEWASAVCIGPGYGTAGWKKFLLEELLLNVHAPLVLDADALNLISADPERLKKIPVPVIITPHPGEMARLLHCSVKEIVSDPVNVCRNFAGTYHVICVLKGARTVISDGERVWINENGNDGMATGGSGDVLAGMITGLLAQGGEPLHMALLGVCLHGLAGDAARSLKGERGMLAGDICTALADVLNKVKGV